MSVLSWLKRGAYGFIRRLPRVDRYLQLARVRRLARGPGYPDWARIRAMDGQFSSAQDKAAPGRRVLMATSIGSHLAAMQMETVLAVALQQRGAHVTALLCDEVLPGCQICEPRLFPDSRRFARQGPQQELCSSCFRPGREAYEKAGVEVLAYSQFLEEEDYTLAQGLAASTPLDQIKQLQLDGVRIGEHGYAGALRYFARATIEDEQFGEPVLRRYLQAAVLVARGMRRLLRRVSFDVAVFHHGIYVPQGIIGDVARSSGVRVVNWNPAYRKNCFIFSHNDTYHHTLMSEPVATWRDMAWSSERERRITSYLRSRWRGDNDWIRFHEKPYFEKDRTLAEIGCDPHKPIIGCLTNVMWDAQLHYPANAFENMLEWLLFTVRYFASRPDLQLVIRVHPAEIRGSVPTRQPVVRELQRYFPKLPENIFVVGPESNLSTYVLAELCDSVIIYGTKTGVELTSMGIPVIVAGEAWIRNKGITVDASSRQQYVEAMDQLPRGRRLSAEVVELARRYAYHFFFRRMIPVEVFSPGQGWPPYRFEGSLNSLRPGADPGLDSICKGILEGSPFVYEDFPGAGVSSGSQ